MDRKTVSNYTSAYKLSGVRSASDTKSQRVKRRSVEQKDLRQNLVNRKRQIGLSPLQEGDTTLKDKSHLATTPRLPKDAKSQAGMNRLEQLKKWKAERELKKKQELEKRKKEPFRIKKLSHKDLDVFGKSQSVAKHPIKPISAPVQAPVVKKPQSKPVENHERNNHKKSERITKPLPAKSYERPTKGSMARSALNDKKGQPTDNRRTTNRSREDKGGIPEKKHVPETVSSHLAASRRISRPVIAEADKPTRTTRQSSRNKVSTVATQEDVTAAEDLNLIKVSTTRGGRLDSLESFAPNDYTFNAASFVFKPLSPNSAAGFLYPGQDTSCSFLDHNPKISSTPKGGKKKGSLRNEQESESDLPKSHKQENPPKNIDAESRNPSTTNDCTIQSSNSMEVEDNKDDTVFSTEHNATTRVEDMSVDQPEYKQNASINEKREKTVIRDSRVKHSKDDTLNETVGNQATAVEKQDSMQNACVIEKQKTPLRRSSRRSVLSSTACREDPEVKPDKKEKESCASVTESETKEKDSSTIVIQSESRKTRRSTRFSVTEEERLDAPKSEKKTSRKSISKELKQDELETLAKKPKRTTRKSVLISTETVSIPEMVHEDHEDDVFALPTDKTTDTLCDSGLNVARNLRKTDLNTKSVVFDEEEGKRTPDVRRGRSRNKSFGGFRLPDTQCAALSASAKRKQRKSVMPKSPEEWVELLSKSPMVEMTRRTPKIAPGNSSLTAIDFDDVDLSTSPVTKKDAQKQVENGAVVSSMPENPKLNLFQALQESENKDVERNQDDRQESDSKVDGEVAEITDVQGKESCSEKREIDSQSDSNGKQTVMEVDSSSSGSDEPGSNDQNSDVHDIKYFRNLLKTETSRLQELCNHWEEVNKTNYLTEEVSGQIRTTVGQAVLLMNQRFKQFTGLVDNCEFKTGEKETTCTDLDGFWDMIYFQVEDVDTKFDKLKKLQSNNWIEDKPKLEIKKTKKKVTKPAVSKPTVKSKFAAFRAQMKKKQEVAQTPGVVTAVEEEKVFEMPGFFRVASPVRSPAFHCEAGTPKKSCTPTVEGKQPEKEKADNEKVTLQLPSSSEFLMKRTPARKKSYAPAVPSPLLVDSTPQPRPTRSCTKKTPIPRQLLSEDASSEKDSHQKIEGESKTPVKKTPRRSVRARKSVNFTEEVPARAPEGPLTSNKAVEVIQGNTEPELDLNNFSEEKFVDDNTFARYLQPMRVEESPGPDVTEGNTDRDLEPDDFSEEKIVDDNVFAKYLLPMSALDNNSEKENSPRPAKRRRTRSSLKACPSDSRRKSSQSRKVHFDSPAAENSPSLRMPRTPFYKEPTERRVTRRSLSLENENIFDFDSYKDSPQRTTNPSRVSLLYTPPDLPPRPARPLAEVPTATLISFTP